MLATRLFIPMLIALSTAPTYASDAFGIFSIVKGTVTVETNGQKTPAKVTEKIFQGSTIETGPDSRAKLTMSDRSVVNISPDSKLTIAAYSKKDGKQTVELGLSQGKIRNDVRGSYDNNNKYLIKTPTAVAGVRGTDFVVNHNIATNTTEVITFQGSVEFTALKNGVPTGDSILVKKDQKTSINSEQSLQTPQNLTPTEKKKMDSESSVTNDSTTGAATAPAPKAPKSESSSPTKDAVKDSGNKMKIGDSKDTAPDTFDPGTKAPTMGMPMAGTTPKPVIPNTAPNPRLTDAIRDKTDKTKVIIKPQGTTTPGSTGK